MCHLKSAQKFKFWYKFELCTRTSRSRVLCVCASISLIQQLSCSLLAVARMFVSCVCRLQYCDSAQMMFGSLHTTTTSTISSATSFFSFRPLYFRPFPCYLLGFAFFYVQHVLFIYVIQQRHLLACYIPRLSSTRSAYIVTCFLLFIAILFLCIQIYQQ